MHPEKEDRKKPDKNVTYLLGRDITGVERGGARANTSKYIRMVQRRSRKKH